MIFSVSPVKIIVTFGNCHRQTHSNDAILMLYRLKSPVTRRFVKQRSMANNKENIKAPHYCLFVRRILRRPAESPEKKPVKRYAFSSHDIIMGYYGCIFLKHIMGPDLLLIWWGYCCNKLKHPNKNHETIQLHKEYVYVYVWGINIVYIKLQSLNHRFANYAPLECSTLKWRHNECDSVSSHQPHDCLVNRLFRRK